MFAALACVPVLVGWFVWYERRLRRQGGNPLVDMSLFAIPGFRRGVLVATLFFFTTSFYFLFGIYQQEGRGVAPLQTGLAILPYGIGLFLGPLASEPFVRLRPRLLAIGMGIQVTGYALVGLFVFLGWAGWELAAVVFVAGFGQGIAFPRLFNTILAECRASCERGGGDHPWRCRWARRRARRRLAACSTRCWRKDRASGPSPSPSRWHRAP